MKTVLCGTVGYSRTYRSKSDSAAISLDVTRGQHENLPNESADSPRGALAHTPRKAPDFLWEWCPREVAKNSLHDLHAIVSGGRAVQGLQCAGTAVCKIVEVGPLWLALGLH